MEKIQDKNGLDTSGEYYFRLPERYWYTFVALPCVAGILGVLLILTGASVIGPYIKFSFIFVGVFQFLSVRLSKQRHFPLQLIGLGYVLVGLSLLLIGKGTNSLIIRLLFATFYVTILVGIGCVYIYYAFKLDKVGGCVVLGLLGGITIGISILFIFYLFTTNEIRLVLCAHLISLALASQQLSRMIRVRDEKTVS